MITKAALLLFRETNGRKELLFVRPYDKPHYIFPGGKQEAGETIEQALSRELHEELAASATAIEKLGTVTGATPDGRPLEMHLFTGQLLGPPSPHAEIKEMMWLTRAKALEHSSEMTPMSLQHVFPFLTNRQLW